MDSWSARARTRRAITCTKLISCRTHAGRSGPGATFARIEKGIRGREILFHDAARCSDYYVRIGTIGAARRGAFARSLVVDPRTPGGFWPVTFTYTRGPHFLCLGSRAARKPRGARVWPRRAVTRRDIHTWGGSQMSRKPAELAEAPRLRRKGEKFRASQRERNLWEMPGPAISVAIDQPGRWWTARWTIAKTRNWNGNGDYNIALLKTARRYCPSFGRYRKRNAYVARNKWFPARSAQRLPTPRCFRVLNFQIRCCFNMYRGMPKLARYSHGIRERLHLGRPIGVSSLYRTVDLVRILYS